MWPDDQLPRTFFKTADIDILNDNLFSTIWFTFTEHADITEAKGKKKNIMFYNVLQRCPSDVINVFKGICDKHKIVYVRGKCLENMK